MNNQHSFIPVCTYVHACVTRPVYTHKTHLLFFVSELLKSNLDFLKKFHLIQLSLEVYEQLNYEI